MWIPDTHVKAGGVDVAIEVGEDGDRQVWELPRQPV